MYLLDTNICIALLKENRQAVKRFNYYFSQCYLSTIIVAELYKEKPHLQTDAVVNRTEKPHLQTDAVVNRKSIL